MPFLRFRPHRPFPGPMRGTSGTVEEWKDCTVWDRDGDLNNGWQE